MRQILFASVGLTALVAASGAAVAADIPYRMPAKAPAMAAPAYYNWSGCYFGAHLGGGWANSDLTGAAVGFDTASSTSGILGGGQLGCNYQAGPIVFGVEGTLSGTSIGEDLSLPGAAGPFGSYGIDWIGTVTGRLGFTWNNALLYAKGGYATAHVGYDFLGLSGSSWYSGWTVGGGMEYAMTPNWILGLEGNYYAFEERDFATGSPVTPFVGFGPREVFSITARVSYKFGWDQPVMARY